MKKNYTDSNEQSVEEHAQERTDILKHSLSLTRATLDSSAEGILVIDLKGNIIDFNDKFISLFHMKKEQIKKNDFNSFIQNLIPRLLDEKSFILTLKQCLNNKDNNSIETIKFKDGRIYEYYTQPYRLNERVLGRIFSFRNITERVNIENQLKHQATHDGLTGLPNRIFLNEFIQHEIDVSKRKHNFFGILFFDLDRFKLVNDSLSHAAGDELLRALATRLCKITRENDILVRIAGDEFVMVMTDLDNSEQIIPMATNILTLVNEPYKIGQYDINVGASIGISIYPDDGKTIEELLRNADLAMYHSKESGKNQFQFYTKEMNDETQNTLKIEAELRDALKKDELFLVYQPQINLENNQLIAVEALVRWHHPKRGVILPFEFIPIAEKVGLILNIADWVLEAACKQNKEWQNQGLPSIRIGINIPVQQIRQINFVDNLKNILNKTGLSPDYLELELKENTVNHPESIKVISAIKELGVHIALDNFGTGYSNIGLLKNSAIDRLKIDRSFIQNIDINESDEATIQTIITIAQSLNLNVIAEGVETQAQWKFLREKNCYDIQGYYFSKPLSRKELENLLISMQSIQKLPVPESE